MTNEHSYMEVSLTDKSGGVIPLELYQHNIVRTRDHQKDRSGPRPSNPLIPIVILADGTLGTQSDMT